MVSTMRRVLALLLVTALCLSLASLQPEQTAAVTPGGVFITGHDADYHAHRGGNNATGARHIIQRAIAYVTFDKASPSILLVTDLRNPGGDQSDPRLGLTAAGFAYDVADYGSGTPGVLDLHTVDFSNYDVIVVASDYGGWLRQDELDILNARSAELLDYVNNGGGIVAFNESGNRGSGYHGTSHDRYGFLPFVVSEVGHHQSETGVTVTPAGATMGLTNADVNGNFSHSYFTDYGGMDVIDIDAVGRALSLATRGKPISTGGVDCTTPDPSVGWQAPLSSSTPADHSASAILPIAFRWGTCEAFIHDESVLVLVVDAAAPDTVFTAHVFGFDIAIDDLGQSYEVDFDPTLYGLPAGKTLEIQVYMGDSLVGTARVNLVP